MFLKGYPLEAKTAPKNETRVCIFPGPDKLVSAIYASSVKLSLDARKSVLGGLRTTKAQTSLRIRAV